MTEKITFKDMLAALPQQQDAGSIVARDANGNPIFISKADLVQVAAELMPVATAEKQGAMSAAMAKKMLPLLVKNNGTSSAKWLKVVFDSGFNALIGLDRNNEFGCLVGVVKTAWNNTKPKVFGVYGETSAYTYKGDDGVLYISMSAWGNASILIFTGSVISTDFIENPPESAQTLLVE